jgi:hypothetical protein
MKRDRSCCITEMSRFYLVDCKNYRTQSQATSRAGAAHDGGLIQVVAIIAILRTPGTKGKSLEN